MKWLKATVLAEVWRGTGSSSDCEQLSEKDTAQCTILIIVGKIHWLLKPLFYKESESTTLLLLHRGWILQFTRQHANRPGS
ncbi:MAG: hypothetical protein ACYCYO_11245 [Bacilli bacterium]